MLLNEHDNFKLIEGLEHFCGELIRYKNLAEQALSGKCPATQKAEFDKLQLELQRMYGSYKEVVVKYGDGAMMVDPSLGRKYNVFDLALVDIETDSFNQALDVAIGVVNKTIGKLKSLPETRIESQDTDTIQSPKAFIAHGGQSACLRKLCDFLKALGVEAVVAE